MSPGICCRGSQPDVGLPLPPPFPVVSPRIEGPASDPIHQARHFQVLRCDLLNRPLHKQSAMVGVIEEELIVDVVHRLLWIALAGAQNGVTAGGVFHPDVDEPVEVAGVARVISEMLVEHELADAAWVLGTYIRVCTVALTDLLGGGDSAHAGPWSDDLGKGVEAHYAAVWVYGEE